MIADKEIDERIRQCAQEEFGEKGYVAASLRVICSRAGVTTGALYKRYAGKEELFAALVEPATADLEGVIMRKAAAPETLSDDDLVRAWDMNVPFMERWFGFLYARYDALRLLLTRSEGSKYAGFEHDWSERVNAATYKYYEEARRRGLARSDISRRDMHIMMYGFWTTVTEPIRHGLRESETGEIAALICKLFDWKRLLGLVR